MISQDKVNSQSRPNANVVAEPPRRNRFYTLKGREDQEKLTDVVTGTLHVFRFHVYALLDPIFTLSFVTPLIPSRFYVLPTLA